MILIHRELKDIKNDVSLGIFKIDVPRLSPEKQQRLLEYFVAVVYKPLYEPNRQFEIMHFFIHLYKDQFRER